jgi:hypothetical protein
MIINERYYGVLYVAAAAALFIIHRARRKALGRLDEREERGQ